MVRARSCLYLLQAELDNGAAVAALRRFNDNLAALPADSWGALTSTAGLVHAVDCRGCRQAARMHAPLPKARSTTACSRTLVCSTCR